MLATSEDTAKVYGVPIRSASRAMEVLDAINRLGHPTIKEIKEDILIPYATVYRIVMTLVHDGWIEQDPKTKRFRPTERLGNMASGLGALSE